MRQYLIYLLFGFYLLGALPCYSQDDFFDNEFLRYEDWVYQANIKTAMLYKDGFELSAPVIQLGRGDQLRLRFDDLKGDYKQYSYTFIHCDAHWQPSKLLQTEYMKGFFDNQITNYAPSFNTIQGYTHYTVAFPNNDIQLTKSGNYLLIVFEDFDHEKIVLTRRFMVFEDLVKIEARVKPATILDDRQTKHEIDFNVMHENYQISNPFSEMTVVLRQNDRWDNAVVGLKPVFVKNQLITFDHDFDNTFSAGNEYRAFDIKSLRYYSERISNITYDSLHNHVYLIPDEKRTFKRYLTDPDINGDYLVKNDDGGDSHTEADYTFVHFELLFDQVLVNGNVYVFGALSDWQFKPEFKMGYNYKRKSYMLIAYLKQALYNYEYVLLEDGKTAADNAYFEGSHWETENNYTIMVYHRPPGFYYDRLVGLSTVVSQY